MKSFKSYITEAISADKNLRLEHLEDLPVLEGSDGLQKTILILNDLIRQVAGVESKKLQVKTKWDGSPSLVCGIDPETKKFFVGTKSVFNKLDPKVNFTNEDIDKNHPEADLNHKLKVALQYLPELNIKTILQGDMLFTKEDLKKKDVHNTEAITFKPNTITYVVPLQSDLAKEIARAKIGIVFHTEYHGDTLPTLKATLKTNLSQLTKTPDVWFRDADFENIDKKAQMDKADITNFTQKYNSLRSLSKQIDNTLFDKFETDKDFSSFFLDFTNFLVRQGSLEQSPEEKYNQFIQYTKDKFSGEASILKTEKGKEKKVKKLDYVMDILKSYKESLIKFFEVQNAIMGLKQMVVDSLNKLKGIGTYVEKNGELVPTNPEGFVVVGDYGAIKLINRAEFSKNNFENDREK